MPPRKTLVRREPNGKPQRHHRDNGPSATEIVRLRNAATAGLRDAVWGTTIGWLFLSGKITSVQFATGKRWKELARDYALAVQAPRAPRSVDLEPHGGSPPDPDSPIGLKEARRESQIIHHYLGGFECLKRTGEPARRAVRDVCELRCFPEGVDGLNHLRNGLDALSVFWSRKK